MPRRTVNLRDQKPLLDIASYARRGLGHRALGIGELEHISRTVRRVPEVMIKVSGGARTLSGVEAHLAYIGRDGELEIETDDGGRVQEKGFERNLTLDWDLDLEARRWHTTKTTTNGRPPKLVHNLVFSMPKGTPPEKLLKAVRVFAREKFALQHRYLMALHTDQGHPHVHAVVKAVSEQGVRLNIRKATLREWRRDFAQYLRDLGVEANATERAVRGETRTPKHDGIYRAALRGDSTHYRDRAEAVARQLAQGGLKIEPGSDVLATTRRSVVIGWRALADALDEQGHRELGVAVRQFSAQMSPPRTDRERIADQLLAAARVRQRDPPSPTR
jgi:Relaxase/Mobilisation nuclease domain